MAEIINELSELNHRLTQHDFLGKGSLTVSQIYFSSPSRCAVADGCYISVDRRLTMGETAELAINEILALPSVMATKAKVEMYDFFNLVKLGQIQMSKKMKINALNYLCYWSKYKHIYDDTVVLDKLRFIQYRFNTIEEFSNSNTLEFVFNKIILNSNITSYAK